jgi:hypothetical protein
MNKEKKRNAEQYRINENKLNACKKIYKKRKKDRSLVIQNKNKRMVLLVVYV